MGLFLSFGDVYFWSRVQITWIKDTMPVDLKANPRLSLMKQGKLRGKAAVPGRLNGFCLDSTLAKEKSSYRY